MTWNYLLNYCSSVCTDINKLTHNAALAVWTTRPFYISVYTAKLFHSLTQEIRSVELGVCQMQLFHFCRAMLRISAANAGMRCPSVCLSRSWVAPKRIKIYSNFFSPSGSQAILVFPCQAGWRYSDGNPLTGASNAGVVRKKCDSGRIAGCIGHASIGA